MHPTVVSNRTHDPYGLPCKRVGLQIVYLVVACVLSTFNIDPPLDEMGILKRPKPNSTVFSFGMLSGTSFRVMAVLTSRGVNSGIPSLSNVRLHLGLNVP